MLGSEAWPHEAPPPPLAGFSFSPLSSQWAHRDPVVDLSLLLAATNPDLVRLPIYWETVEPSPDRLDFSSVDALLEAVVLHNERASNQTRVVLTIGARNFLYPELHEPAWAGPRQQPHLNQMQSGRAYRSYIDSSILRYRGSPLLYAWQVENEPFDYVVNDLTGDDQIQPAQLAWEIDEVHRLDPGRQAMTTTFDGWNVAIDTFQLFAEPLESWLGVPLSGHPADALAAGDVLGLDLYVDGPSVPLRFTSPALRSEWKAQAIEFWAAQAAAQKKQLWLAEVQAAPWGTALHGFTPADLIASAAGYRRQPVQVVLMWGADTWLQDPAWLSAGAQAMAILRAQ